MRIVRVITLGTGAGRPTLQRSSSSVSLDYNGKIFLFDCGENTQLQLMKSSLRWVNLEAIFIGHLHGDHVNGLPGLLATMGLSSRRAPLKIFGPVGMRAYLETLQQVKNLWMAFPVEITEIKKPGVLLEENQFFVETLPLNHVIDCWGYRFQEKDRAGHFDEIKAKELQIPFGPIRARLIAGENITLENGTTISPKEIIGPKRKGRSVVYSLDTAPCENTARLAHEATCLIHETTFDKTLADEANRWGHSTTEQAANTAKEAGTKRLIITHISPRYQEAKSLIKEVREVFSNAELAYDLAEFEVED